MMNLIDNVKTTHYTYNAAGERIMKSYGTMEGVYINGAPQGIILTNVDFRLYQDKMSKLFCAWFALKFHETDNFTLYPASILSVNKNRFTKHYFIGDKRVASRIGTGMFNNVYGRNGSYVTAGQQDYAERMNQIQTQKEAYYKKVGVAPGVPTEKGAYGDPENTGVGYNAVLTELGNHDVPQGWVQTPHPNTTPGTNPGTPISWNDPTNPDDPQAGYGYIPNDTTKEETFFYHSDHLGSTSYITDDKANITQYDAYLPYGELLVDEHSSSEDLPYKFNGKQFDEETGLYYYGARYLNSVTSLWYGVDPLTEKYPDISSYSYCHNNPILLVDPDGAYPIITITKQKTGRTTWQRIIGYTGQERDVITRVNLYKVTVRDTEDKDFRMEFSVTRDAFTVRKGDRNGNRLVLSNVAYEPKKEEDNRYTAQVIEYPRGNGTKALKLKQHGSEVMYATSNNVSVEMGYRNKSDVAAGVMMHVGGIYNLKGEYHYAASEGCFEITNSDKSSSNDSTNKILDSIINQSRKSKTNKNRCHNREKRCE